MILSIALLFAIFQKSDNYQLIRQYIVTVEDNITGSR